MRIILCIFPLCEEAIALQVEDSEVNRTVEEYMNKGFFVRVFNYDEGLRYIELLEQQLKIRVYWEVKWR